MSVHIILLLAAFILFVLGTFPVPTRFSLISAGLACATLAFLWGSLR